LEEINKVAVTDSSSLILGLIGCTSSIGLPDYHILRAALCPTIEYSYYLLFTLNG